MDMESLTGGLGEMIPNFINNTRTLMMGLGEMIFPDNPTMGVLIMLIIAALILKSRVHSWMWMVLFVGLGFVLITGGII